MALSYSKRLFALLYGKTSKHCSDIYCLNCLNSFSTENKFKPHENARKDFGEIVMPAE